MTKMALRQHAGFSLIEVMVASAILVIVLAGVLEAFTRQQKSSMLAPNTKGVRRQTKPAPHVRNSIDKPNRGSPKALA